MAAAEKLVSPEAFLDWEATQTERHEYYVGSIYAMAGMSYAHSIRATNLVQVFGRALRPPCRMHTEGLKVQLGAAFVYPDALILCGSPTFYGSRTETITNPTVIFEILSESTEAFDRGEKFRRYRSLEGLQAVVFVSQNQPLVEVWTRAGESWNVREYETLDAILTLTDPDVAVPLSELYDGIEFPDSLT